MWHLLIKGKNVENKNKLAFVVVVLVPIMTWIICILCFNVIEDFSSEEDQVIILIVLRRSEKKCQRKGNIVNLQNSWFGGFCVDITQTEIRR